MSKPPHRWYEEHVVMVSIIVGIGAWFLDAAIDSLVFSHNSFLDSLVLEITPHEFYFRLFIVLILFVFSMAFSKTLARRQLAEEELRNALNRLEDEKEKTDAVIAAIPDGISIQDRNYRVLYQNQVHRALVGDQVGRVCYEKYASLEAVCPGCPVARSFEDGGNHTLEKSVPDGDGGARTIEISSSPLSNSAGEVFAGIEAVRDITERKQAEEELKKHRERLEDLVQARTAELKSASVRLRQESIERERVEAELARVQKLDSLGLLAGGIAHDFNNLLGAMMGNISLAMLDMDPKGQAYRQLAKAEQASLRAQDLTHQLLTFSRGGAPIKKPLSVAGVVSEAAGLSLNGSRILHEIAIPRDLWPVEADEGQVMQVLNNLLINADQAMPGGGIVRISAQNVMLGPDDVPPLEPGRYVRISVHDEGHGIAKDHLDKVFDPFFTTQQKGSGLGLAAGYTIIRKHDGLITVESEPGRGATFHVYLPASHGGLPSRRAITRSRRGRGAFSSWMTSRRCGTPRGTCWCAWAIPWNSPSTAAMPSPSTAWRGRRAGPSTPSSWTSRSPAVWGAGRLSGNCSSSIRKLRSSCPAAIRTIRSCPIFARTVSRGW